MIETGLPEKERAELRESVIDVCEANVGRGVWQAQQLKTIDIGRIDYAPKDCVDSRRVWVKGKEFELRTTWASVHLDNHEVLRYRERWVEIDPETRIGIERERILYNIEALPHALRFIESLRR